jgi:hypothetical protein
MLIGSVLIRRSSEIGVLKMNVYILALCLVSIPQRKSSNPKLCKMSAQYLQISLHSIPCYVLTTPGDEPMYLARRAAITKALEQCGFKNVIFVLGIADPNNTIHACAFGHILLSEKALVNEPFEPYLMLEDDSLPESISDLSMSLPLDADALYVSTSRYGAALSGNAYKPVAGGIYFSSTNLLNVARVYNMLSTHAILVLSERFARNLQRCAVEASVRNCHVDVFVGLTQRFYNVYGQIKPIFYQAGELGGNEADTRIMLSGIEVNLPLEIDQSQHAASIAVQIAAMQT